MKLVNFTLYSPAFSFVASYFSDGSLTLNSHLRFSLSYDSGFTVTVTLLTLSTARALGALIMTVSAWTLPIMTSHDARRPASSALTVTLPSLSAVSIPSGVIVASSSSVTTNTGLSSVLEMTTSFIRSIFSPTSRLYSAEANSMVTGSSFTQADIASSSEENTYIIRLKLFIYLIFQGLKTKSLEQLYQELQEQVPGTQPGRYTSS